MNQNDLTDEQRGYLQKLDDELAVYITRGRRRRPALPHEREEWGLTWLLTNKGMRDYEVKRQELIRQFYDRYPALDPLTKDFARPRPGEGLLAKRPLDPGFSACPGVFFTCDDLAGGLRFE